MKKCKKRNILKLFHIEFEYMDPNPATQFYVGPCESRFTTWYALLLDEYHTVETTTLSHKTIYLLIYLKICTTVATLFRERTPASS
jgi:hypothetical protein